METEDTRGRERSSSVRWRFLPTPFIGILFTVLRKQVLVFVCVRTRRCGAERLQSNRAAQSRTRFKIKHTFSWDGAISYQCFLRVVLGNV